MARRTKDTTLPAPFLKRISLKDPLPKNPNYPLDLPFLGDGFEISFEQPVTIISGENGTGKSTLIEALAQLCGFSQLGGSGGHSLQRDEGREVSGATLGNALRGAWLPKVNRGWFFRAETFFDVARYLDASGSPFADFLSHSHGEGFLRLFSERMSGQGVYLLDEPESALSPRRQIELLRLLADVQSSARAQVIMATHSPILMAVPGADLWRLNHRGLVQTTLSETDHFKLYSAFTDDPSTFIRAALDDDMDSLV
ncbi:recombination protein F [Pelagimonas phthalicica]|uniref:Recombination protein F n=1 Tax=Pelagimonas phthalicica TaxID=1037362 RepID=A0A238JFG8_9RHOB|nr:AAA family ATPase [Pelagimonas phthalicica]TDS92369.1 putative ATPase [Pelagimonas phthalicica]SMX29430.1 recombination protein F [Pelagimonas phthalicica]